jgi:hypothetical protein
MRASTTASLDVGNQSSASGISFENGASLKPKCAR